MKEEWKDVVGYKGIYKVSNTGKIINSNGKIIKQFKDHKGYLITQLSNNKKKKTVRVHRIVAYAFIPNPENKPQINHINCNKEDNRIENLEWCTNEENKAHAKLNGLCKSSPKGGKNKRSKKVIQYDLKGRFIQKWDCINDAVRELKLGSSSNISECCKNKKITNKKGETYCCKTAYGYKWKYAKE